MGRVCALTTNPRACVHRVTDRVAHVGPAYILPAKFLPGTGNLIAAASGFAGVPARVFFPLDALAISLWAGTYMTVGWVFAARVEAALAWAAGLGRLVALLAVGGFAAAIAVRAVRMRGHRRGQPRGISAPALPAQRTA